MALLGNWRNIEDVMLHVYYAIISIAYATVAVTTDVSPRRRQIESDDIGNLDWRKSLLQMPRENRIVERRLW